MNKQDSFTPRKQPSQSRSTATYEAILEAAARVLEENGYATVSTNLIAEKAGVSIGSLYEYFPTKDAIFAELIRKLDKQMADAVIAVFPKMNALEPKQFLAAVLRARVKQAIDYPVLDKRLRSEVPAYLFEEQMQDTFDRLAKGMRLFATSHPDLIRVKNLDVAIELGAIVVESTIRSIAANNPERLEDEALVDEFVDMMLRYILKE